ncbi:MAG: hypothetical protein JW697_03485 [Kosmotogaceae bacterium]|nr:hypothetical protein [Kosmotogaceae bacterium]
MISGKVFGDFVEDQSSEMFRYVHRFITVKGFEWGRSEQPGANQVRWYLLEANKASI